MKIEITNDIKYLRDVYDKISKFCEDNKFGNIEKFNLNLIVEEYITNIINHGTIDGKTHKIEIELNVAGKEIQAKITDDAAVFNPLEATRPDLEKKMQEKQPGGLGVFLILEKAEEIKYYRKNNTNNFEFILTIK
jgi:anti-sigma regulatory factor (Ser/Thr protein kinase)